MSEKESNSVELPCGVIDATGVIHREVVLSKMTGRDRKAIAEQDVVRNGGKIITTLLMSCVQEIGSLDLTNPKAKREVLLEMLTADRTFLVMALRRLSVGSDVSFSANCLNCSEKNEAAHKLEVMEIRRIPATAEQSGRNWLTRIEVDGHKAALRFPNGGDEELVSQYVRTNPIEAQYRTLSRCLKSWDENTAISPAFFDDMELPVIDELVEKWNSIQPGIDLSYEVECWSCKSKVGLNLQALDFLFPSPRTRA